MKQPNYDLYNALVNSLKVYDCEPSIKKFIMDLIARYCGLEKTLMDFHREYKELERNGSYLR